MAGTKKKPALCPERVGAGFLTFCGTEGSAEKRRAMPVRCVEMVVCCEGKTGTARKYGLRTSCGPASPLSGALDLGGISQPQGSLGSPWATSATPPFGGSQQRTRRQTQPRSLLLLSTKRTQARHPFEPPASYHAGFRVLPSLLFFMYFYLRISAVKCMSLFLLFVIFAICEICG